MLILAAAVAVSGVAAFIPYGPDSDAVAQRGMRPGRAAMTYVAKAGAADLYEIQSSQLAVQRANRPQVRAFAQMLVADHTRSTQMVTDAARADGLSPPPPMLEPAQRTMIRQLERARPRDFDRTYLNQQVIAHQQALMLHRNEARGGTGALRRVAGDAVPIVRRHLDEARRLSRGR
jgi:putative membrane protein